MPSLSEAPPCRFLFAFVDDGCDPNHWNITQSFGDFEHHFQIFVEDYIPNISVMFTWDIYQPRSNSNQFWSMCWLDMKLFPLPVPSGDLT